MKISRSCVVATAIVLAAASTAFAQTGQPDTRWRPWLGCWSTVSPSTTKPVCVVPAPGTSAVDIVVVADGKVASREHVEASGERRRTERDGCTGWESAQWSSDSRRVYLQSEFECPAGQQRTSSGLIAMSPQGEWLDLVGVTLAGNTGVRVLHHRAMGPTSIVPAEITAALQGTAPAFRDAAVRVTVAGAIGTAEIAEASRQLKPQVVEAWLSESGQEFTVDSKRLVALAAANVPDRIIDVLVALSYPTAFAVRPSSTAPGLLTSDEPRGGGGGGGLGFAGADALDCSPFNFSLYGWDACSPFSYGPLGYRYSTFGSRYSRYGAGAIDFLGYGGLGYDGYGGGWYLATQPTVIVLNPGGAQHGQVVNGRGYVEGGTGASTATPISSGSSSSGSSSSGGSSSGGSGATSSPSSGGDSGGGRTAVPR
jgi:hypothetical protein